MVKEEDVFSLLHDINNLVAEKGLTIRESVRLYLSLISMAFSKGGAVKAMIPFILKETNDYLSKRLNQQLK